MNIYVGNLPWSTTSADLEHMFGEVGSVNSAQVISDRDTGRSRGFGFVEMSDSDGTRAIAELNGREIESRSIRVNEANQKPARSNRY